MNDMERTDRDKGETHGLFKSSPGQKNTIPM